MVKLDAFLAGLILLIVAILIGLDSGTIKW